MTEESLQSRFKAFRKQRMKAVSNRQTSSTSSEPIRTPEEAEDLRAQFLHHAHKYCGVPYSRKHHKDFHESFPGLYLDCCGLIRRVFWKDIDAGFNLGPWNQKYYFEALNDYIIPLEQAKPGDLIFYKGVRTGKTDQTIVHVEILLENEQSLGSRYSGVDVREHFLFDSSSWSLVEYYICSIDSWFSGILKQFPRSHKYFIPLFSEKSIFFDETEYEDAESDCETE
ncbi:hypothetical protein PCE1_001757 [Barthelona sp. PCE]